MEDEDGGRDGKKDRKKEKKGKEKKSKKRKCEREVLSDDSSRGKDKRRRRSEEEASGGDVPSSKSHGELIAIKTLAQLPPGNSRSALASSWMLSVEGTCYESRRC